MVSASIVTGCGKRTVLSATHQLQGCPFAVQTQVALAPDFLQGTDLFLAQAPNVSPTPPSDRTGPGPARQFDRLVTYANRLPVGRFRGEWRPAAGGLVSALRPALQAQPSTWVGWDGGGQPVPRRVPGLDLDKYQRQKVRHYRNRRREMSITPDERLIEDILDPSIDFVVGVEAG